MFVNLSSCCTTSDVGGSVSSFQCHCYWTCCNRKLATRLQVMVPEVVLQEHVLPREI